MRGVVAASLTTFCAVAMCHVPSPLPSLLVKYFGRLPGNHFYFCKASDAVATWRQVASEKINMNVRVLSSRPSPNDFIVDDHQPQRMGIFLDLSCPESYVFLDKSRDLFNATYRWMLLTDDLEKTLSALVPTRLEADSDGTILLTSKDEISTTDDDVRVFRISRIHFKAPFNAELIPREANPDLVNVSKPDFRGYRFNTSLMMIDIKFNKSNLLEPLLDRSFAAGSDMVRRYGLSLFLHMAEYYNYTMSYVLTDAWGDPFGNGSWSGMVGQVQRGEAEFGLAPAKYITPRYVVIDYVTSLHIVRVCFTFLQPKLFGTYKALVLPLDADVWLFLGLCSLGSVIAFWILVPYDKTSGQNDGLAGSAFLVVAAVANQGIPDNTNYLATRIVYLVVLMVSFFVGVYYNAAILNGLLLQAPNAIQNIEQLLESDIRLAMLDIPYLHDEMTHNDTMTIRVRTKLEKHSPPHYFSVSEGVAKMRKGQFALYTEDEAIYHEIANTLSDAEVCSVSEVEKYKPFHVGAVARLNGPYKELFNRAFTLMRERGLMDRQKNYWLLSKPECHWRQDALSLGLEPMFLAYTCMILGSLLSFLFYFLEKLHHRGTFERAKNWIIDKQPLMRFHT
ncbi:hypothetical protein GE061_012836 [Apolygus lucorum]|uniref:Ionotropic glutamate receptor C-terminal domain-containing protein n=1 Tax=Apolygus lucorum TaxID=248454 RepID=A0A8S9XUM6_APOLU|nr:hypothetical protein GE061_012836 [Apolygus lucorum]